jgi:hypothetical protein
MAHRTGIGCAWLANLAAWLEFSRRDPCKSTPQPPHTEPQETRSGFRGDSGILGDVHPTIMPAVAPPPRPFHWTSLLRDVRDGLVSLRLTIVLLGFSMVLVFAATLDQVNLGIWAVQEKYFRSFIVYVPAGQLVLPAFPGGYTIGGLLLANLIAAHVFRFTLAWRKTGIMLTHLGLIVLLIGELLSGLWQQDFHLRFNEGEAKNFAESFRQHELVLIDVTDAMYDEVIAIPEALVARKATVQHPKLPFRVASKTYYPNSSLHVRPAGAEPGANGQPAVTMAGVGGHLAPAPQPVTHRSDERNIPSAVVELQGPDGSLGTYLVSGHLPDAQVFTHAGRTWKIALRVQRAYLPFSLTLLKFSHDRYAGTEIPKNFSSRVRIDTSEQREQREVLIFMNNPLRYDGMTFYQAGFENDDRTSILQVVRNPSWLIPYIACALMTLGLAVQFGIHLFGFVRRRSQPGVTAGIRPPTLARADGIRSPDSVVPALAGNTSSRRSTS